MVVGDVTTAVDVLVLGAGPGGYVAAIRAAQLGHHVTLVDPGAGAPSVPGAPGGTCLHRGCIPLKALLSASERYAQARQEDMGAMGIHVESISLNWPAMQDWKQGVVNRLSDGVRKLISGNRIEYVTGTGWFINEQEMRVEGEYGSHHFKFDHCILAVGAEPAPLPGLPYDGKQVLTPEQALMLPALPEALSIYGDDYIALELATVFARLGVAVKLYAPGEHILVGVDPAALRLVQAGLRKLGIAVTTKAASENIAERPIVISNGVCPHTAGLHLHDAGVEVMANGGIAVNTMQQSNVPHIYAVGDCAVGARRSKREDGRWQALPSSRARWRRRCFRGSACSSPRSWCRRLSTRRRNWQPSATRRKLRPAPGIPSCQAVSRSPPMAAPSHWEPMQVLP